MTYDPQIPPGLASDAPTKDRFNLTGDLWISEVKSKGQTNMAMVCDGDTKETWTQLLWSQEDLLSNNQSWGFLQWPLLGHLEWSLPFSATKQNWLVTLHVSIRIHKTFMDVHALMLIPKLCTVSSMIHAGLCLRHWRPPKQVLGYPTPTAPITAW